MCDLAFSPLVGAWEDFCEADMNYLLEEFRKDFRAGSRTSIILRTLRPMRYPLSLLSI